MSRREVPAKPAAAATRTVATRRRLRAWREQHVHALLSSLGRLARRPFATLLTVGVMAVALALPLGLGLALANIERFSGSVAESREVSAFLKPDIDAHTARSLAGGLTMRPDVAEVKVKTPEEALAEFRAMSELGDALDLLAENPLPAVLVVQPRDDGAALVEALQLMPQVEYVQHDAVWRQRLGAWLGFGERLVQVIAVLLGLGVLLVVGNTVRLDIAARAEEIGVLQHLGATDGFVRRPFLYLGACYGLLAGLFAAGLLAAAGQALQPRLAALVASYGSRFTLEGPGWQGGGLLLVAAAGIGWLGAWLATGHHLRRTRPTDV
ncbi:permease-like cell division protein FtsX [Arenimonas composti]|uniref:Cell division protein FtsX n=1 Tax=Arenimonas composti TR7-09 = DSM 18010 TaxID=1121013 RepID=A0A091BGE5_9GAMM|nr:permease-like cell division protein FtsX [Arenimonas composti]KFN49869.1 hypothetical protein P873_08480 [Arenimonas composti TR7-09 = DSM 18010]